MQADAATTALPAGACDTHTHIFEPARYAYDERRSYTPGPATVCDLRTHLASAGFDRVVLVQPSVYGTDNRAHRAAIAAIGQEKARGVAVVDPERIETADLDRLHAGGFRGARLNTATAGSADPVAVARSFKVLAARVAPLGWAIQIFAELDLIEALTPVIAASPVPVILDHYGRATPERLAPLLALVATGHVYVKLAAPYRVATAPDFPEAAAMTRALVAARPDRMLWGSDWPHPRGGTGTATPQAPAAIEPFLPHDDAAAVALFRNWLGSSRLARQIFVDTPHRLFFAR